MIRTTLSLALAAALAAPAHADTRLLRFPDVSDTHVAFVHAGDISRCHALAAWPRA